MGGHLLPLHLPERRLEPLLPHLPSPLPDVECSVRLEDPVSLSLGLGRAVDRGGPVVEVGNIHREDLLCFPCQLQLTVVIPKALELLEGADSFPL